MPAGQGGLWRARRPCSGDAAHGPRSHRSPLVRPCLRKAAEDPLADADEVDALGDAEERGDDQRPAARALQEGERPLLRPEFPGEGRAGVRPTAGSGCGARDTQEKSPRASRSGWEGGKGAQATNGAGGGRPHLAQSPTPL